MDIDGVRHSQSRALLRWAGQQSGLYPSSCQLHVDAVLDTITDIQSALVPAWYSHACGRSPVTGDFYPATRLSEEQVAGVFEALNVEILPVRFQQLERVLTAHRDSSEGAGPYFCGDVLTIADVSAYVVISGMRDGTYLAGLKPEILSGCPLLLGVVAAVAAHPQVQAWEGRERER
jgi:glutathione S-transferase